MTRKIAIVGGSATGKTTLLIRLEKQYSHNKKVVFVHESARQFFTQNPDRIEFTFAVQEKILDLVFENEEIAMAKHPRLIVTDTSALEVMFYTKVHGDEKGASTLLKRIEGYISTYTKFLVMNPNDVSFENDAIRRESKETRDKTHHLLIEFYHQNNLRFELISGTIPERHKRVSDIINTYLTHA